MSKTSIIFEKKTYDDRESKGEFISSTYVDILNKSILNIGSGEGNVRKYINQNTKYLEIDKYGEPDLIFDLENDLPLPFDDNSFETVICTDVLEHLDNFHDVLDEIFRVSNKNILISLPNCHNSFYNSIFFKSSPFYSSPKYYGLPLSKPSDRHKWFFSSTEILNFFKNFNTFKIEYIEFRLINFNSKVNILWRGLRFFIKVLLKKSSVNIFSTSVFIKLIKNN